MSVNKAILQRGMNFIINKGSNMQESEKWIMNARGKMAYTEEYRNQVISLYLAKRNNGSAHLSKSGLVDLVAKEIGMPSSSAYNILISSKVISRSARKRKQKQPLAVKEAAPILTTEPTEYQAKFSSKAALVAKITKAVDEYCSQILTEKLKAIRF